MSDDICNSIASAVQCGDWAQVEGLCSQLNKWDINEQMRTAVKNDLTEFVKILAAQSTSQIALGDCMGLAIAGNHLDCLSILIENTTEDTEIGLSLKYAAQCKNSQAAAILLEHTTDPSWIVISLEIALVNRDRECVKVLMDKCPHNMIENRLDYQQKEAEKEFLSQMRLHEKLELQIQHVGQPTTRTRRL